MNDKELNELGVGRQIWVECTVNKGPFPSERGVIVNVDNNELGGFVDVGKLRFKGSTTPGNDYIIGTIVQRNGDEMSVSLPWDGLSTNIIRVSVEQVKLPA